MAEINDQNNDIESDDDSDGEYYICSDNKTGHDDLSSKQEEICVVSSEESTSIVNEIQKTITEENIATNACEVDNSAISEHSEDINTTLNVKGSETSEIQQDKNVGYPYNILNKTIQTLNTDCILCRYRNQRSTASWHCKDCQETLCEKCCTEHRKSKVTSNHIVVSLPEGTVVGTAECDVCNMDGTTTMASVTCEKCDENLCEKCSLDHKRRKATKDHILVELQKHEPKHDFCDVCKSKGAIQRALYYCDDCCEKLCQACSKQHKTRKATTEHILLDLESCHLKSTEVKAGVLLCDPCEQMKKKSFASSFCESCGEFLCISCVNHHKKMKATSNHVVSDLQEENGLSNQSYTCDPCSTDSKSVNAHFYCRVCEEYFCTPCSKQHRSFKITKDHKQVNLKEEIANLLLKKIDCDICKIGGIKKIACLFCDTCDESYCSLCSKIHSSQKATRQHELVDVDKRKSVSTSQTETKHDNDETSKASTAPGKPIMEDVTANTIVRPSNVKITLNVKNIKFDVKCKNNFTLNVKNAANVKT